MTTWSEELKILLDAIVNSFKRQHVFEIDSSKIEYKFEEPSFNNDIVLFITTKRKDDNLKMRIYLKGERNTLIGKFRLTEMINYGPGLDDEIYVSSGTYDSSLLKELHKYAKAMVFADEDDLMTLEDDSEILLENGNSLSLE